MSIEDLKERLKKSYTGLTVTLNMEPAACASDDTEKISADPCGNLTKEDTIGWSG
jgi:ABC-type phosphate transport system ATPase subunit